MRAYQVHDRCSDGGNAVRHMPAEVISEQERVARELNRQVAVSTTQLAVANEELKRSESLLNAEKRTLEMIANGASLPEVLNDLCTAIDAHAPPATSMVCLMDANGKQLLPAAGPRVSVAFTTAITPWPIGPGRGSCGTAAFTKQRVIIPDISNDPRWPDEARGLALSLGFCAAWSEPLISKDGDVLGTFCLSYGEPRTPNSRDLELIEAAGNIARIAIERERSRVALTRALEDVKRSEGQLRNIFDSIPGFICSTSAAGEVEIVNQRILEYLGMTFEEVRDWSGVLHKDERDLVTNEWRRSLETGEPYDIEHRIRRADGVYRWFHVRGLAVRDGKDRIVRWNMLVTDIDDRKIVNAQIKPQVTGYLLRRAYEEGSLVRQGQLLFEIDPRTFQAALDHAKGQLANAEGQLAETEANQVKAQLDVDRYGPLAKEQAVSQQELDHAVQGNIAAQAQVRAAQAQIEAARAQMVAARLNLGFTKIVSLIDGIAGIAQAQIGDLVAPTSLLTTVSTLDPIKVHFPVSEQDYLTYVAHGRARERQWPLELLLVDGTRYPRKGAFSLADRQVDVRTGTLRLEGLFPNPGSILRPGQFARVRAITTTKKGALLIPQRAVTELQGSYQVAVVGEENTVEIRPVKVGERIGTLWIVNEGLTPGERVVADGIQRVRAGMTVNPRPFKAVSEATPRAR